VRVFNLGLDGARAASSLVLLFVVTAIVFSVFPLLCYLRGHTIFDYELWYATGKHVVTKSISSALGNTISTSIPGSCCHSP
jgi:hypothetical protein